MACSEHSPGPVTRQRQNSQCRWTSNGGQVANCEWCFSCRCLPCLPCPALPWPALQTELVPATCRFISQAAARNQAKECSALISRECKGSYLRQLHLPSASQLPVACSSVMP